MTLNLPHEMRQALAEHPEKPLHVVDAETQKSYVLLPAKTYDQVRALLADGKLSEDELFQLAHEAFQPDWDAPGMGDYENYDEARKRE
jgi:hypothetical protein